MHGLQYTEGTAAKLHVYSQFEKIWSRDQKIKENPDGSADITFTAASESEVISLILSQGDRAKILKPKWLVEEVKNKIFTIGKLY